MRRFRTARQWIDVTALVASKSSARRQMCASVFLVLIVSTVLTTTLWLAPASLSTHAAPRGPVDDAAIEVWFDEGCDRSYAIGEHLHLRFRANVNGMARVWRQPDEELFTQEWLTAGVVYEIEGPVTGPPGSWWILGELLESGATDTCHYTTTLGAVTPTALPTVTATAPATAPVTSTATATAPVTTTATSTATATAPFTSTATVSATTSVTATATPSGSAPTATLTEIPQASMVPASTRHPGGGFNIWLPFVARGAVADLSVRSVLVVALVAIAVNAGGS